MGSGLPPAPRLACAVLSSRRCYKLLEGKVKPLVSFESPTEMIPVWPPWQVLSNYMLSVWMSAVSYCVWLNYTYMPGAWIVRKWHGYSSFFWCRLLFKILSNFFFYIWYLFSNISIYHLKSDLKKNIKVCVLNGRKTHQLWLMSSIYSMSNLEKTMLFHKVA